MQNEHKILTSGAIRAVDECGALAGVVRRISGAIRQRVVICDLSNGSIAIRWRNFGAILLIVVVIVGQLLLLIAWPSVLLLRTRGVLLSISVLVALSAIQLLSGAHVIIVVAVLRLRWRRPWSTWIRTRIVLILIVILLLDLLLDLLLSETTAGRIRGRVPDQVRNLSVLSALSSVRGLLGRLHVIIVAVLQGSALRDRWRLGWLVLGLSVVMVVVVGMIRVHRAVLRRGWRDFGRGRLLLDYGWRWLIVGQRLGRQLLGKVLGLVVV